MSVQPSRPPLTTQAAHRMNYVIRTHLIEMANRISAIDLHPAQVMILMQLSQKNIPSQRELADRLGITPAAVTSTLNRLEKEGCITRTATDGDLRRNRISLTPKGQDKLEKGKAIHNAVNDELFADFSEDEIRDFIHMLERLQANVEHAAGRPAAPSEKSPAPSPDSCSPTSPEPADAAPPPSNSKEVSP